MNQISINFLGEDIDITIILIPKTVNVIDVTSTTSNTSTWNYIGCSSLAINEVNLNNTGYQELNRAYQLGQDLINGYEQLNNSPALKKLYTLGLGAFQFVQGCQDVYIGAAAVGASAMGEPEDNVFGFLGIYGGLFVIGLGSTEISEGINHITEGLNDPWN